MPSKNVLAILSGVVAAILVALAVWTHGHPLATIGATVAAVGFFTWSIPTSSRKNALVLIAMAAGSSALFVHYDNFWGLFACAGHHLGGVRAHSGDGQRVASEARLRRRGVRSGDHRSLAIG